MRNPLGTVTNINHTWTLRDCLSQLTEEMSIFCYLQFINIEKEAGPIVEEAALEPWLSDDKGRCS